MIGGFGKPAVPGNSAGWLLLAVIGIVLVLVNYIVQYGLARVPSNRAIVIMLTELGFAAVASWLLAGESFGLRECIGGAMILGASVFRHAWSIAFLSLLPQIIGIFAFRHEELETSLSGSATFC